MAALVEPLRDYARQNIRQEDEYALVATDWSKLDYGKHTAKTDTTQLTHENDIGYELTTQLLINQRYLHKSLCEGKGIYTYFR